MGLSEYIGQTVLTCDLFFFFFEEKGEEEEGKEKYRFPLGLIFVQKAFLRGLFGELIFRRAYYWKEFYVSEWVALDNKNSIKKLREEPKKA